MISARFALQLRATAIAVALCFSALRVAQATETFTAALTLETSAGKESTQESVTRAVKARVAKRSKKSEFSMEDFRTGTDLNLVSARGGGCGADETVAGREYRRDFESYLMGRSSV